MTPFPTIPVNNKFAFVSLLRAVGALMVVWCHVCVNWPIVHGVNWVGSDFATTYVTRPFAIMGNMGQLGVGLFFLVSGFIITHVGLREDRLTFAIKRLFRIYPPLIVSILLIVALNYWYTTLTGLPRPLGRLKLGDVLSAMSLGGYFTAPQIIINSVCWTLVIELAFYTATCALLPVLKRAGAIAVLIQLAGLAAAVWVYRPDGSMFSRFVGQVGLVPCLLVGQITYLRWSGRIAGWTAVALTATALWLFTYTLTGVYPYLNEPANSFGVSFLYAYLMFIIAVLVNDRCRLPRFLEFFSDTSYSLYLNHAAVGFFMLDWLRHWRFELALVPTLAAVTATAWLSWLLVERPSQDLGRWLVHGLRKAWRNPDPVVASKVERPPLRRAA